MNRPSLSIITASAGTGKTYRLAIEYVRIVLDFYGTSDFSLDNILVLTFTRKATAEIRDRIVQHMILLGQDQPGKEKERQALLTAIWPEKSDPVLSVEDKNRLLSAWTEISSDRRKLQVMTLDSYIGGIFRNIVRPLRSIDTYEIDTQAVDKRLPFLLDHLMSPELKPRLDNLLRRKVSPSLDEYRRFFASLIQARWLYYLIDAQKSTDDPAKLMHHREESDPELAESCLINVRDAFTDFLAQLQLAKPDKEPADMFNADFKRMFFEFPADYASVASGLEDLLSSPEGAYRVFRTCNKLLKTSNLFNGNNVKGQKLAEAKANLVSLQNRILINLADHLVHTLFLPEMREIQAIWKAILDEYDKLIYRYKNLTYDDVAWFTLEALFKGPDPTFDMKQAHIANEFYFFLSHRSRFILIDEFQDTSLLQFNILRPIIEEVTSGEGSRKFAGLTVVGDVKQSIFGWRGGERDLLLNLRKIFPTLENVKVESLDDSYRSSKAMMEFINSVFGSPQISTFLSDRGLSWDYGAITSKAAPEDPTQLEFCALPYVTKGAGTKLEEVMNDFVRNSILPLKDNFAGKDVAILCRKGSELNQMQQLLEEAGIPSIFQPSSILTDHAWVSPLVAWLRWLAYGDWLDFLEVLRSNYILLKAAPFKSVVDAIASARAKKEEPELLVCPVAASLFEFGLTAPSGLAESLQGFVDLGLADKTLSERDYLNILSFITIAQDYVLKRAERDKSIPAFLDYLEANKDQEFLKQVAVEGKKPLQLLTIHKSKGLQFDRVFVFYNLSGRSGNQPKGLEWSVDYASPDFQLLSDYATSYHYSDLLAKSSYSGLVERTDNRVLLEEMNTLYVAFTRAKTALHVCMAFQGSEDYDAYLSKRGPDKLKFPDLLADASRSFFQARGIETDAQQRYRFSEELPTPPDEDQASQAEKGPEDLTFAGILPPVESDPYAGIDANALDPHRDWKRVWVLDRHQLTGDLVHHYLSFVLRNLPEEHARASKQCLARFGSLLSQTEILSALELLRQKLPEQEIFPSGYDKVFTELTLYHSGRELRLDRLLLDTQGKRALILDYKTGATYRPEQLEEYRSVLLSQAAIQAGAYTVATMFINLDFW